MVNISPVTTKPDSTALLAASSTPHGAKTWKKTWSREDFLPALAGLLLGLAFAPTNLVVFAFFGLVPLFIYLDKPPDLGRTIRAGLIFPLVMYGFTLNWLAGMVGFSWLSVPGYLIIISVYAFGFFVFVLPVITLKHYLGLPFWVTAPFAWVACERLRGYGDLAFPWSNFSRTKKSPCSSRTSLKKSNGMSTTGARFWITCLR